MPTIKNSEKVLDVLIRAKEKISDPARWTQGCYARDIEGNSVSEHSSNAVCWCAIGAIFSLTTMFGYEAVQSFADLTGIGIIQFNDGRSHSEVMEMFDIVINKLKQQIKDKKTVA